MWILKIWTLTSSEHVGGQTHSIPILLSLRAAISSGGFKLENTSECREKVQFLPEKDNF